jgi:acetyltransferase
MKDSPPIRCLFEPRSVAVIGASASPGKIGFKLVENMILDGFQGTIYPVNPKGGEVLERKAYARMSDIPGEVDVALIAVPAKFVFDAVRDCAAKDVKFLCIVSSGFSEVGNRQEEQQIVQFARQHGMRILGPNISGYYSARVSMNASFGPRWNHPGNLAIVTQSGALGVAMVGKAAVEGVGLSAIVSMGNKSDLTEADILDYLVDQDETRVILLYIEGVQQGEQLVRALKTTTLRKPVIVIKSGRSKRGAMAAASHTGSLAGADEVFDAVMKQCGVLRAETIQEAFQWSQFLADAPKPCGRNTVIVTNGGGVGVMATDAAEKFGVDLYDDQKTLREIFAPATPDFGSTKNPVDITGQAGHVEYSKALNAALESPQVHSVVALYCETAIFTAESLSELIRTTQERFEQAGKPLVFSIIGGQRIQKTREMLKTYRAHVYEDVYDAVSCLGALYRFHENKQVLDAERVVLNLDLNLIDKTIQQARKDGRTFLLPRESSVIMREIGVAMPASAVVSSLDAAVAAARQIGYPVVMKIVSKDIIHKSDAGGVALDLEDEGELIDAYQAILHNARRYNPKARIDGVEVSEMLKVSMETIVGARQDATFGPVVMFGLGGIYVEVMKDVTFRSYPMTHDEALEMVQQIRSYPLLLGVRGEKRKDIGAVVDVILRLGCLIQSCAQISDIELNPLVVYEQGKGVKALDVRILLTNVS